MERDLKITLHANTYIYIYGKTFFRVSSNIFKGSSQETLITVILK